MVKKRIVFIMSVGSHQNATFGLARALCEIGYDVSYAGLDNGLYDENLRQNAVQQGFSYTTLDPYMRLDFESMDILLDKKKEDFISIAYNLLEGDVFRNFILSARPDLILVDIHFPLYVMGLAPFKVPTALLSTELYTGKTKDYPPLTSSIIPENSAKSRFIINEAWQRIKLENRFEPLLTFLIDELSEKNNFPKDLITERCVVLFGLKYRELVLWPGEFEFSPPVIPNVSYIGSYVCEKRNEIETEEVKYKGGKETIYFAVGTVLKHEILLDFVSRLLRAFMLLPEYSFVVSLGRLFDSIQPQVTPGNVEFHRYVPQLTILKRASLMITMGGGNSIKECIEIGVPMLCYPFHNDQFGNSARVEFHKLGLKGNLLQDRPEDIANRIKTIVTNPEYKKSIWEFAKKTKRLGVSELRSLFASLILTE